MSWPDVNPVWQFCWLRPQDSGGAGSGLEIRDVYYNGHLVMKRGHVPILNVEYLPAAAAAIATGRTRSTISGRQRRFSRIRRADEPGPDRLRRRGELGRRDIGGGLFAGVAAEKLADRLILTTQTEAAGTGT